MNHILQTLRQNSLVWYPEHDLGFYPVKPVDYPYDAEYWAKYEGYAATELGQKLREAREAFVAASYNGPLVDVGIGCGDFLTYRNKLCKQTFGHDINPVGVKWLEERGLLVNPWETPVQAASFWDVIEHVEDHAPLLENIKESFFVSVPIFLDEKDVLRSKHFRRDEHYWYWTRSSIRTYFASFGFECIDEDNFETRLGRESIGSFVFRRS